MKYVLQIMLSVGICLWLVYQVKRSHYKKKEFDESDKKVDQLELKMPIKLQNLEEKIFFQVRMK